jgi:hypothetical protein
LNIQRLGFPFWKSHAGHYMPFAHFPNPSEIPARACQHLPKCWNVATNSEWPRDSFSSKVLLSMEIGALRSSDPGMLCVDLRWFDLRPLEDLGPLVKLEAQGSPLLRNGNV